MSVLKLEEKEICLKCVSWDSTDSEFGYCRKFKIYTQPNNDCDFAGEYKKINKTLNW